MQNYKKFIIGNMNEKLAARLSNEGCIGLGIDEDTAHEIVRDSPSYRLECLDGKWYLDVWEAVIGKGIPRELNAEKISRLVPHVIGSQVLEKVCLTADYLVSKGVKDKDRFYLGLIINDKEIFDKTVKKAE